MRRAARLALVALLGLALGACADALRWRHYDYVVQSGDTLYSVAWHFDVDFRDLARWNDIRSPYTIYPGEHLQLSAGSAQRFGTPPRSAPAVAAPAPAVARRSKPAHTAAPSPPASRYHGPGKVQWGWPTQGTVISRFDADNIDGKGIDIGGKPGDDIRAAAAGRVVYSGSGLIGYGQLIIIKHNDHYLSAYAHNRERFVREGDQVKAGEKIATMGRGNSGKPLLHFEIRYDGKPVDPLDYLPSRD